MRPIVAAALCLLLVATPGCAKLTLAWADLRPNGTTAEPPALNGALTAESWENGRKEEIASTLEREVYGVFPDASETTILSRRVLDNNAFNGLGVLEEIEFSATATFNNETVKVRNPRSGGDAIVMNVVLPKGVDGAAPVILMQTFCPRWDAIPHPAVSRPEEARSCSGGGMMSGVMHYVFGRYIATPPVEDILRRGYGLAAIDPAEYVPDSRTAGLTALERLAVGHHNSSDRWGAVAAWGWGYSRMADILLADDRIRPDGLITWGHSRYGKAALVAAAYDERIGGVIAHQSGTGGASLNREKKGESVEAITDSYPHWFNGNYADFAGEEENMESDQHFLLALIAPRPVLLGNARRDVWSDPNGAFRAAQGADPAYELYGARGLDQKRLDLWKPSAEIAFWIRPGTHGVVKEDWPAFLEFLDAHIRAAAS